MPPSDEKDEINELADSVNNMLNEVSATDKIKNDFITTVSHELRTPLTAIKGWGEMLRELGPDDMITFTKMCACMGDEFLSPDTFEKAIFNYTPNDKESRGLGFQLKGEQPFSAGDEFSVGSYGHTGYSGTSVYIDKQTGLWAVLLTNTVHYGRAHKPEFIAKRKEIYSCILKEYKKTLKERKI